MEVSRDDKANQMETDKANDNPNRQQELEKENLGLRRRLEEFAAAEKQHEEDETAIKQKMDHGLNRDQARAVIQRQRDFDAAKKATTKGIHL